MNSPKNSRKQFDREYKKRIVQEYLDGASTAQEIAAREGLEPGNIYRWKNQLSERARSERIETIASEEGIPLEQARRIKGLEDELAATQKKLAQLAIENEILGEFVKKTDPSSLYAKRSNSYADIKIALGRPKGRAK